MEWNRVLFNLVIPQAWKSAIETLARLNPTSNIYAAWPAEQPTFNSGDAVYWRNLPLDVLKSSGNVEFWPIVGENTSYGSLRSALVVPQKGKNEHYMHRILAKALVRITEIPMYLFKLLSKAQLVYMELTPQSAHAKLAVSPSLCHPLCVSHEPCVTVTYRCRRCS